MESKFIVVYKILCFKMNNNLQIKNYIFGSKGFIASNLIIYLKKNKYNFTAFDSNDVDLTNSQQCKEKLKKINFDNSNIIFLSGLRPNKNKELHYMINNLLMIYNLNKSINLKNIRQFVYISSDAVYSKNLEYFSEETKPLPDTSYGFMHLMRENFLKENISPGKLTILRPCAIYGLYETFFNYGINGFLNEVKTKKTITLFGKGEELRDHLYVKDLIEVILISIKNLICGTFNVSSGKCLSFFEISKIIKSNFDKNIKIKYMPRKVPIIHKKS